MDREQVIDLLCQKRDNRCSREWAARQIDSLFVKEGNYEVIAQKLNAGRYVLTMRGGDFCDTEVTRL